MRTLWLLLISLVCCPNKMCDGAVKIDVKHNLDDLLIAIATVESSNDPNAYNVKEAAAGLYQIRPIYLRDVNRILRHQRYKLADRYDPARAREMVCVYLRHYGKNKSLEDIGRKLKGLWLRAEARNETMQRLRKDLVVLLSRGKVTHQKISCRQM